MPPLSASASPLRRTASAGTISKLEAAVKQLVNRAASGEFRATQLLLALAQANESRPASQDEQRFSEDDAVVMKELARRLKGDDE